MLQVITHNTGHTEITRNNKTLHLFKANCVDREEYQKMIDKIYRSLNVYDLKSIVKKYTK